MQKIFLNCPKFYCHILTLIYSFFKKQQYANYTQ